MSKVLLIESCEKKKVERDFSSTSIVHVRNSLILEKELGYKLITHGEQIPSVLGEKWDHIVCVYASPYMKYHAYLEIIKQNPQAQLWWAQNDHDNEDNILLRQSIKQLGRHYNMICNNPRAGYRHWILGKNMEGKKLNDWIDRWETVNWNTLIFDESMMDSKLRDKSGCIYFGTFRKHRAEDMAEFNGIKDYWISSSLKNQIKYQDAGIEARFIDKIDWKRGDEELKRFKYSIYFEDKHTHDNYAFLANRFYECLMCDTLLFFDAKCMKTVESARQQGYIINDNMIVKNAAELNSVVDVFENNHQAYYHALSCQRLNIKIASQEKIATINHIKKILS